MSNKIRREIVFVVLTYANCDDLEDFISSSTIINASSKIIIVNSYYDESTLETIRSIADKNDCDFIGIENKGYGYGNNIGIAYAREKYDFDYLIISNPDIIIRDFNYNSIRKFKNSIIGPNIITSKGKKQNPFYVKNKYFPRLENRFMKKKNYLGYYSIMAIYKFQKKWLELTSKITHKNFFEVYALHGSFMIFHKGVFQKLDSLFDENIFLFCEEMVLAVKAKKNDIPMIYINNINVLHKEDGSMKFMDGKMYDIECESNTYVVNNYY